MSAHKAKTVKVTNRRGLHARASAKLVNLVHEIGEDYTIEVEKDGNRVPGTSIMGIMMLGAAKGDKVTLHVTGDEPLPQLRQLLRLFEDRFGED